VETRASGLLVVIVLRRGVTLCVTRDAVSPRRWEDNAVLAFTGHALESGGDKKRKRTSRWDVEAGDGKSEAGSVSGIQFCTRPSLRATSDWPW